MTNAPTTTIAIASIQNGNPSDTHFLFQLHSKVLNGGLTPRGCCAGIITPTVLCAHIPHSEDGEVITGH